MNVNRATISKKRGKILEQALLLKVSRVAVPVKFWRKVVFVVESHGERSLYHMLREKGEFILLRRTLRIYQSSGKTYFLSDVSKFCSFGIKGPKLVRRKRGTALSKKNPHYPLSNTAVVALWGVSVVITLYWVNNGQNSTILKANLEQSAAKLYLENGFSFSRTTIQHTAEFFYCMLASDTLTISRSQSYWASVGIIRA